MIEIKDIEFFVYKAIMINFEKNKTISYLINVFMY